MDFEIDWVVSDETSSLIEAINSCKKDLTKQCFAKFGSAKILEYIVLAPQKVCEILALTESNKAVSDKKRNSYCHKLTADFEQFSLYKTKMFGDSTIRLEAKFDAGEGVGKYWYGNINLT